ncbi:MAG: hypothetical protein ACRD1G_12530, partial [Acidimicrobiales bacterium]
MGQNGFDDAIVARLVGDLASSASGLDFVYRVLDSLIEAYGAQDAVVLIDDPAIGRQAFRARRRALSQATWLGDPVLATPGLHTHPDPIDTATARSVAQLCQVALQLDLRRHDASRDALTGLFNRRSFDAMLEQSASRSGRY